MNSNLRVILTEMPKPSRVYVNDVLVPGIIELNVNVSISKPTTAKITLYGRVEGSQFMVGEYSMNREEYLDAQVTEVLFEGHLFLQISEISINNNEVLSATITAKGVKLK